MKLGLGLSLNNNVYGADFTPANLTGLQLWFRKNTGITTSGGGAAADNEAVHGWADQSGNNRNATGAATRFTFDSATGGIEGTGNNKLNITQIDFTGQFAFYARLKFDTISSGANDILFRDAVSPADDDFFRVQTTTQIRAKIGSSSAMNYDANPTISTGSFINIGFERDADNNCRAYQGGAQQDSEIENAEPFNLDRVMGAFDGICVEIIVTNAALSNTDRSNLNNYLNNL